MLYGKSQLELIPQIHIIANQVDVIHCPNVSIGETQGIGWVLKKQLKYLARCVELLRDQTKTNCETKMKLFV